MAITNKKLLELLNMDLELEACHEAPFYTLGPLTTDIAPGSSSTPRSSAGSSCASRNGP